MCGSSPDSSLETSTLVVIVPIPVSALSYFSVALAKHHDPGNLLKKALNWPHGFRGLESLMAEQRHSGRDS